jgi:hypothetical protein
MDPRGMNVIVVGPETLERLPELPNQRRATVYSYYKRWWTGLVYFHRDGHAYRVSAVRPPRPFGAMTRVLSYTIHNPAVDFAIEYDRGVLYALDELRSAVTKAIEADDDIITQFHDPEELVDRANRSQSFEEFLELVAITQTPVED